MLNMNMSKQGDAINQYCPRSGKDVVSNSYTLYREYTVGFCNPGCRDDFRDNLNERPKDRAFFDKLIDSLM
ncbi:MAG: hypothetical protein ACPGUE_19795 [Marinomonas sp.]|uniref:hypothetical protein n=1 Tax=unclassified Marinomonas TaxID=196814 RepID=UPI000AE76A66|nr:MULTISPECIES: hypothetical protein [unclassified Marinomonas]